MSEPETQPESQPEPLRHLGETQRRVLGCLLEKAYTTPEYYPMTLKGLTAACNQKNNRDPVLEFDEEDVDEAVNELEQLGLTERVFLASGRTERIRHLARKKFTFSEPQLAVMTELWLRGRQSLGDVRARASRMVQILDQDTLRAELRGLLSAGCIQANGPLEVRGVEIDHNFYMPAERRILPKLVTQPDRPQFIQPALDPGAFLAPHVPNSPVSGTDAGEFETFRKEHQELREEVTRLRTTVEELADKLARISSELGIS